MNTVFLVGFIILGLVAIIGGILNMAFPRMWWWWEEFKMKMRGIDAKPNSTYDTWQKITGLLLVVFGFIMIAVGIFFGLFVNF